MKNTKKHHIDGTDRIGGGQNNRPNALDNGPGEDDLLVSQLANDIASQVEQAAQAA